MTAAPLLVVNGDDYGLTPGVCEGILRAGEDGVLTSTSVLAVAPAFAAGAPRLRDSGLGVGCHLALVGEDPLLLGAAEVPTLVDRTGRPAASWRSFLGRALRGRVDPDDVRREFGAQIEACRLAGLELDHLDTHQHLHLWPSVARVVIDLAVQEGIGALRVPTAASRGPKGRGVRAFAARLHDRVASAGLVGPSEFAGLDGAGHLGTAGMVAAVERLGALAPDSAELGVHPGTADDPDRARYRWGYKWPGELTALCDPALRSAVGRAGFRLGTFSDLGTGPGAGPADAV